MKQLFFQTFKLNNAIASNQLIYYLRKIPFFKRVIPNNLYGRDEANITLAVITHVIGGLREIGLQTLFLLFAFVFPGLNLVWTGDANMMSFLFPITLFAAFFNNPLFSVTQEMYNAIILLKVSPNQYGMMNFTKTLIKKSILSLLILFVCSLITGMNMYYCIFYPVIYVVFKIIIGHILIYLFEKKGVLYYEKPVFNVGSFILMIATIALLIVIKRVWGIVIPDMYYLILSALLVPVAYMCYQKLLRVRSFKKIYKKKLIWENLVLKTDDQIELMRKNASESLTNDLKTDNSKHGYAYLSSIFFNRHRKILLTSTIRSTMIFTGFFVIVITILLIKPEFKEPVIHAIQYKMLGILTVIYYINTGNKVVQAMFVNCDRSFLNYRFYRQRSVILALFVQRLKMLVRVNLLPSLAISIGVCALAWITVPTINLGSIVLIFISLNSVSVLFSVYHLTIYYLLQPYDDQLQARGYIYHILQSGMYLLCYQAIRFDVELHWFFCLTIIGSFACSVLLIFLVFCFATRTFRVKR